MLLCLALMNYDWFEISPCKGLKSFRNRDQGNMVPVYVTVTVHRLAGRSAGELGGQVVGTTGDLLYRDLDLRS